jgi:serine phosphatase RsbU (regulator of sigma subunit)/pSer/pThr/pTyr-binding forkhead associated (FHA) protein
MFTLQVLKGANEGTFIPLKGERFVLGRNPDCDIVIPVTSVSREHAEITQVGGKFYIRDNNSRNHTYVNNQEVTAQTVLKNNDKIRICDFVAAFIDSASAEVELFDSEEEETDSNSTVEAMLSQNSSLLLEEQPAEKLRHLLEISSNLSRTLELDKLLPQIVDSLFQLFRQADRAFLIMAEDTVKEGHYRLMPRVVKTRRPTDEANARFSKNIIRSCLETGKAFLSDDAQRDGRVQLSQSVVDFRIRSVMCVPLCGANGKPFAVIQLDTQDRSKKFTQDDLKLLWGVANQAAVAMENARMHEDSVLRERMRRDLMLAKDVQLSFLPKTVPSVHCYEFARHYKPAQAVGGDYYGFIPLSSGRLAVAVGDVAGKGVPASLLMAKLSSDTRFSLSTEEDVAAAVTKLNDLLYEFLCEGHRFVTFAVAVLDPSRHEVTIVSAGHESPLLYRSNGELQEVITREVAGFPLGIMEGASYSSCQLTLEPGESLLIFTDGVKDALNVNGDQFKVMGIQQALQRMGAASPVQLVETLAQAIDTHAAGREPFDDVTLVGMGRVR